MHKVIVVTDQESSLTRAFLSSSDFDLTALSIGRFADSESYVSLSDGHDQYNGATVFILFQFYAHDPSANINDRLMQLFIIADFIRQLGASKIIALLPYLAYGRQEETQDGMFVGPVRLISQLCAQSGFNAVASCEIHSEKVKKLFAVPLHEMKLDSFWSEYLMNTYFPQEQDKLNWSVLSPDVGGIERAKMVAQQLNLSFTYLEKVRTAPDQSKIGKVHGKITKKVIIIDDILGTGRTAVNAASLAKERGAETVIGCFTHPVLSTGAVERLKKSCFDKIVITDTLILKGTLSDERYEMVSVGDQFAHWVGDFIKGRNNEKE
jgi:ribose-phosphate pyrophosphokinase